MDKKEEKRFKCNFTGIKFNKTCQIYKCPANIKKEKHESGCLFYLIGTKKISISKLEQVEYKKKVFELPGYSYIREEYNTGIKNIKNAMIVKNLVDKFFLEKDWSNCSFCGIHRIKNKNCSNQKKCNRRKKVIEKIISKNPFNIDELNVKKDVLWFIIYKIVYEYNLDLSSFVKISEKDIKKLKKTLDKHPIPKKETKNEDRST